MDMNTIYFVEAQPLFVHYESSVECYSEDGRTPNTTQTETESKEDGVRLLVYKASKDFEVEATEWNSSLHALEAAIASVSLPSTIGAKIAMESPQVIVRLEEAELVGHIDVDAPHSDFTFMQKVEFETQRFPFLVVREGMKKRGSLGFARGAEFELPLKENRSGTTARGYAAYHLNTIEEDLRADVEQIFFDVQDLTGEILDDIF